MMDADTDDDIPSWERVTLRSRFYESHSRNGEPCISFYSAQFPGSKGDDGYVRRTDIMDHSFTTWGDWDNLDRDACVKQLATLEASLAEREMRVEEPGDRLRLHMGKPLLSDWQAAQLPIVQNDFDVSRPLTLARTPTFKKDFRLRLKTS